MGWVKGENPLHHLFVSGKQQTPPPPPPLTGGCEMVEPSPPHIGERQTVGPSSLPSNVPEVVGPSTSTVQDYTDDDVEGFVTVSRKKVAKTFVSYRQ